MMMLVCTRAYHLVAHNLILGRSFHFLEMSRSSLCCSLLLQLLLIVACLSPLVQSFSQGAPTKMGIVASKNKSEGASSQKEKKQEQQDVGQPAPPADTNDEKKQPSKSALKKAAKTNHKWKAYVAEFKSQVLDEAYISAPIRANIIEASELYPKSESSTQECLLPGSHKHLGGAYDPTDGCIYGVPANSKAVLCLYPDTKDGGDGSSYKMTSIPLPDSVKNTQMKWLRGIFQGGYLWAIPAWANAVLCVDVDAFWGRREADGDIVKLLDLPEEHPKGMTWQWHGAGINKQKDAIYCIPSNAQKVLKVDLKTKTTSLIPIDYDEAKYPSFKIDLSNKFYGGILGEDNCVYGVPYRSCAVLRIDCDNDSASLVGPDYGVAGYNWHGGIQIGGKIYAHPSHADDLVLVINTNPDCPRDEICTELPIKRAEYDKDDRKNFKWLGGSVGADGNIYCPACDTSSILRIDTKTDECTTFGFAGKMKNKWQGGVYSPSDQCIYCIPASGHHILRIYTGTDVEGEKPVQLLGEVPKHKDKWQGGHVGLDGRLYFIPENGYRVMKVTPPKQPPKIVDGKLPDGDVLVEYM